MIFTLDWRYEILELVVQFVNSSANSYAIAFHRIKHNKHCGHNPFRKVFNFKASTIKSGDQDKNREIQGIEYRKWFEPHLILVWFVRQHFVTCLKLVEVFNQKIISRPSDSDIDNYIFYFLTQPISLKEKECTIKL